MWLPKRRYGWGSVSLNLFFALDPICSFRICDARQTINQSCFTGFFFGTVDPLPFPFLGLGMNTVSKFSFSQIVEMIHTDFQGLPPSCIIIVLPVVQNAWEPYRTRLRTTGSTGEACLPPPVLSSLLDCDGEPFAFISPLAAHSCCYLTTGSEESLRIFVYAYWQFGSPFLFVIFAHCFLHFSRGFLIFKYVYMYVAVNISSLPLDL